MFRISLLELMVIFIICTIILSPRDWKIIARKAGILTRKFKNWTTELFDEDINIKNEITKIKREILKPDDEN